MAGEAVVGALARPTLKGLHQATIKKNLAIAIGLSLVFTAVYKVVINDPKKRDYAEFYKKYDCNASFERMRKAGLFQGAPADK